MLNHKSIYSPQCTVNLLGRDLLMALRTSIKCAPTGQEVQLPEGTVLMRDSETRSSAVCPALQQQGGTEVHVYWLELLDTGSSYVVSLLVPWLPWLRSLHSYSPTPDVYRCALLYDGNDDEVHFSARHG